MSIAALPGAILGAATPSWRSLLGDWSLDLLFVPTTLAGYLYLSGVRRLAQKGRTWPVRRSAAFMVGLAILLFAGESGFAQFDRDTSASTSCSTCSSAWWLRCSWSSARP